MRLAMAGWLVNSSGRREAYNGAMTAQRTRTPTLPERLSEGLYPLENGDHLTRDEFERRYNAMPDLKKAELLGGVVYMPSPVRYRAHGKSHAQVNAWLSVYWLATPGAEPADNASIRLDPDSMPQPDAILRILPEHGGQSWIDDDDYLEGPPELIVEVAASIASYDLHEKLAVYQRNKAQEYLVWQVLDKRVTWLELVEDAYRSLAPNADGVIRSRVFPGLWLDVAALIAGDMARMVAVLQAGLGSREHLEFAARLAGSKGAT
jgi:Uma2 family endonuclease